MPTAHAGETKYAYLDHDTDLVQEIPPVLNQWYTVFDAEDVRLLWCSVTQTNDEAAVKNLEVRWTIDTTVYFMTIAAASGTYYFVFRYILPSAVGTAGLAAAATDVTAARYVDKRGQSFKVEVRIVTALGTNQTLLAFGVRETLEQT